MHIETFRQMMERNQKQRANSTNVFKNFLSRKDDIVSGLMRKDSCDSLSSEGLREKVEDMKA